MLATSPLKGDVVRVTRQQRVAIHIIDVMALISTHLASAQQFTDLALRRWSGASTRPRDEVGFHPPRLSDR
jgi:hypothetical protein